MNSSKKYNFSSCVFHEEYFHFRLLSNKAKNIGGIYIMDVLTHVLAKIQTAVWGPPTLFLLMGTGFFSTIALGGLQVVKFPRALKCIF